MDGMPTCLSSSQKSFGRSTSYSMLGFNPAFASRSGDPFMEKGERYVVRNMYARSNSPSKHYWDLKVFYSIMLEVYYSPE